MERPPRENTREKNHCKNQELLIKMFKKLRKMEDNTGIVTGPSLIQKSKEEESLRKYIALLISSIKMSGWM